MLFWHSPRLFSPARRSSKFIKAKNMPNLEKWSGLFSILVTEILNLRDCSQQRNIRSRPALHIGMRARAGDINICVL